MAKFKVVTPAGAGYSARAQATSWRWKPSSPLGAEIVEIAAKSEDEFVAAARDADALYAKGRPITKKIIDGLDRCKIIALGSVGVDSVDVPPPPPGVSRSPTCPTPSSRKWPTTP